MALDNDDPRVLPDAGDDVFDASLFVVGTPDNFRATSVCAITETYLSDAQWAREFAFIEYCLSGSYRH